MGSRSRRLLRCRWFAAGLAGALVVGALGCGSEAPDAAVSESTTAPVSVAPPSVVTTASGPSTTHPLVVDTAPTVPVKPAVCEPDMGTTLLAEYVYPPFPAFPDPPAGWVEPTSFDWDGDGVADTLLVTDGEVVVDWGGGQVRVTGVVTDFFAEPGVDDDGNMFTIYDEAVAAQHVPAAVGDVTGDGFVDLLVSNGGHTAVFIGQGAATPTGVIAFEDLGRSAVGWRSPAQRGPQHYTSEGELVGERVLFPNPVADVAVLWDADGDGANEFSVTRWHERSAPGVVRFAGVACSLP